MSKDYLPSKSSELIPWLDNFATYLDANKVRLGISATEMTDLTTARDAFDAAFFAVAPAQAAAKAAVNLKNSNQRTTVELIRKAVRQVQASPACTDEDREKLGINIKKPPAPAPKPTTRPTIELEQTGGMIHTIRLSDAIGKGAKPDGVTAAKVYMKIATTPPADPSELPLVNIESRSKFEMTFDGTDIGKTAYYGVRWTNARGEEGPISLMIGATIAA